MVGSGRLRLVVVWSLGLGLVVAPVVGWIVIGPGGALWALGGTFLLAVVVIAVLGLSGPWMTGTGRHRRE